MNAGVFLSVQIDMDSEGRHFISLLTLPQTGTGDDILISEIRQGPGVDLDPQMAKDFVQGWILEKLSGGPFDFDKLFGPATRYDRIDVDDICR